MEDWNFKQVLGVAFICVGGVFCLIGSLVFLFTILQPGVAILLVFIVVLLLGILFWKIGCKENNNKKE